ncbi:hypothetical protein D9758_003708 [Tetrapyrgos nigripes]|uniref:GPI anchored protein n=1 Tax=Tetrapyrgos nigripes TaxID=182062 RepID=A0A8H5LS51_9AGAR|nr:hypothetical protein D9758_003708 [Tetrapyrgos nigripes]
MKSSVAAAAVVLAASGALAQDMTINTPVCLSSLRGQEEVLPTFCVTPGGQPGASPIVDLGQQTGTSLTWVVNVAQGTSVGLEIRDSTGLTAQSAPVTIQNSSNSTCVGQAAETAAASGSAGATSGATGGATQGSSTGSGSGSTTNTGSGSSPTQTKPTSTTGSASGSNTSSGAGSANTNGASNTQLNVAGAIGAAVLAFFV